MGDRALGKGARTRGQSRAGGSAAHLQVPVHHVARVEVLQRRHDLGAVEARPVFREHPLSRQVEEELERFKEVQERGKREGREA